MTQNIKKKLDKIFVDKELEKMKLTLVELIQDERINNLERWHMTVLNDVLSSNELKASNKQKFTNVLAAYQVMTQTGLSHNSLRLLRSYIRENKLKLEH